MKFESTTLSQKIAQSIADKIAESSLKPGERLLENELTETFGTSRAPIREALYILEKDGLVERIPRRGVFVKEYNRKELFDLYEVVYRLEEIALVKVIERATDQDIEEVSTLIKRMSANVEGREIKNYFSLLEELHRLFFRLTDNDVLTEIYIKINKQLIPFRYMSLSYPNSLEHSISEYYEIVQGLQKRNSDEVIKALYKKEKRALSTLEKIVKDTTTIVKS